METLSTSTTTSQAATGPKRVAVVLFNFSNDTGQPYTPAYAAGVAFTNTNSAAAYYAENSWGQLTLSGDVYGWYTIPNSNTSCDYTTWGNSANQAASTAGVNLSAYDYVVYGFPAASSCHWSGIANLPGRYSWLNGAGAMGLRTMAHELGHNFGTHHASSLSCIENGVRVSLSANSANCSASEYGDPFSIMGSSAHEHTNFALGNFGWLQTANTQTVTTSGDYLLKPLELYDPGAVQALRIQRTPSTYLTLEFRQPGLWNFDPFSATDPAVEGVTVRITPGYSTRTQSQLVDTTPATSSFADAPLAVGQTLVDPVSLASITDVGVSPLGATVRISFAPDTSPPSQPGNLTATPLDAGRVSLSWSASSDNARVAGYRVYRNKLLVATVTSTGFTDGGLSPSTSYAYSVVAFDAADNLSTVATAFATTPAADTQPPSAPGNLTATVAKGKKVALSWTAAGDNVGVVGYRIYRDGTPVATTAVTSFTDAVGGRAGAISYYVVAYDAAGNVSAASNSVSVTP
jgi:hypothetical protein